MRAIDHMEFHPTLGRAKTGSTIRLKRQPKGKDKTIKASQYINQMKGLTKEDKLMLRQANELTLSIHLGALHSQSLPT